MRSPAAPKTQASILTDLIRQDIVAGAFAPGSKLKLRELSEKYGAGSIPLREALSRLTMSGFVEAKDQRGFRVAAASEKEMQDILRVRLRLETDALRDAIAVGDLHWESSLLAALHRLGRVPMVLRDEHGHVGLNADWDAYHDEFHAALIAACSSPWLLKLVRLLRLQSSRYRFLSVHDEAYQRDVHREHQAITDAALARDADTACRLLTEHLTKTVQLALETLQKS